MAEFFFFGLLPTGLIQRQLQQLRQLQGLLACNQVGALALAKHRAAHLALLDLTVGQEW